MDPFLTNLTENFQFSGSLPQDAAAFLIHHGYPKTAAHSRQVAETAAQLAQRFGLDPQRAAQAGWMHDISAVYPNKARLEAARALGLDILPEEVTVPLLLHQKISAVIAKELFNLQDEQVLEAVRCHTTLKPQPGEIDLVLFVADKLAWDKPGSPPYSDALNDALTRSLEESAWVYQQYLWQSKKIKIVHPWMHASYLELTQKFG